MIIIRRKIIIRSKGSPTKSGGSVQEEEEMVLEAESDDNVREVIGEKLQWNIYVSPVVGLMRKF